MKLNLAILSDAIKPLTHCVVSESSIDLNLIGIRLFNHYSRSLSRDYIYLLSADELSDNLSMLQNMTLMIIGDFDVQTLADINCQALILSDTLSIQTVLEKTQTVFDDFTQWNSDLFTAIISSQSIQNQLDICASVLKNPIALFDLTFLLIAKSGQIPDDYTGTIWEHVINKGYSAIEDAPSTYRKDMMNECIEKRAPIIFPPLNEPAKERLMTAVLLKNNIPFATIGTSNILEDFTLGQLSLVAYIQKVFENSAQAGSRLISNPYETIYLLDQLLRGFEVEPDILESFLKEKKWNPNDHFMVFSFSTSVPISKNQAESYLFRIHDIHLFAYVTYMNNAIHAIYRCPHDKDSFGGIEETLTLLLKKIDLTAGVSMEFSGYIFLHQALLQSLEAIKIGQKLYPDENYVLYERVYLHQIMQDLADRHQLESYCHPKIQRIIKNRNLWEIELIHTLYRYLVHGKNTTATAASLFIHRNTLLNRISAIEAMLDLTLDSLSEPLLNQLYFSCFIADYLIRN